KGRPSFNPLIAHVADADAARALAHFPPGAKRLASAFWPGPLTLVLPKLAQCRVAELATAGLDTIAVRVPSHPLARATLLAFGPTPAAGAERAAAVLNLSRHGDLIEAAANLFSHLRALDAAGATTIAVMPVPRAGLGEAINDRLERAAAPRP